MAKDVELDHLKAAQDLAFQRKQDAWQAQDQAWQRCSAAKEVLDRAYQAKQSAYAEQEASWQSYQQVRTNNGPRIDQLNAQQENAFQRMKSAFDSASSAHDRRDGLAARQYADEGHRCKAEAQGYVVERRRLVEEIRSARSRHEPAKLSFQHAKDQFTAAKHTYDQIKSDHEREQARFKQAKADFDQAKTAFHKRLEEVRSESKRRKDDRWSLAEKAGVPFQYRNNVLVSHEPDGMVNIYFGGIGEPNGLGHGHYTLDPSGKVTYRREPSDPHGSQNFTEPQYWHKFKMAYQRDSGTFKTDNYIGIVGNKNQATKAHVAVNADGVIVFVRDIDGTVLYDQTMGEGYLPDDLDWSK
jgi:hypothetical protein